MKTIAFLNEKGGTGKTTSLFQTAARLHDLGNRVLLIDTDPQGNLSLLCNQNPLNGGIFLSDVFNGTNDISEAIITVKCGFDLVTGGVSLAKADMDYSGKDKPDCMLRNALTGLQNVYDFALIDNSPHLGLLAGNAITAADVLVMPSAPDLFSLQVFPVVTQFVSNMAEDNNPDLKITSLITRYQCRQKAALVIAEQLEQVADSLGVKLFKTRIRESAALRNAANAGTPIFEFDSKAAVVGDFKKFVDELIAESEVF